MKTPILRSSWLVPAALLFLTAVACRTKTKTTKNDMQQQEISPGTFLYDVQAMEGHKSYHILKDATGQKQVLVSGDLQGRVMTSSLDGPAGYSIGWVNTAFIQQDRVQEHFNPWGGEERIWLGPEGGQFSLFFKKGDPFDLDHWYTPSAFDTEPFETVSQDDTSALFRKEVTLVNYAGTVLKIGISRRISLLGQKQLIGLLGDTPLPSLKWVGYESRNTLTNLGENGWDEKSGMPSVWLLGMLNPSDRTTVVIPFHDDPGIAERIVNDEYFGKIPADRLKIANGVIFFRADGKMRGKIGLGPHRAKEILGSYDEEHRLLTIVWYNKPRGATEYVNSMWRLQENPFQGDVVNAYNDGPLPGGGQLGPFYELETSSPAARLNPGEQLTHISRTWHFTGDEPDLDTIAQYLFGVGIGEIRAAF